MDNAGALVRGSGVASTSKDPGSGTYRVTFTDNIGACGFVATPSNPASAPETIQVGIQGSATGGTEVFVQTADATGALTDSGFMLVVVC